MPWNVDTFQRHHRTRSLLTFGAACLAVALASLILVILRGSLSGAILLAMAPPVLLVWLWRAPVRGVYVLVAAAATLETAYSDVTYPDDIGHYIPFFEDFTTWTHVGGLAFTMAEIFLALILLIWIIKGIADRTLHFQPGTLLLPLGLYGLMVAAGEAHGLGSGGDFRISLWEIRSQIYMLITYILACNLVKSRRSLNCILWIVILGAGIKGVQGTWRLYFSLHGDTSLVDSLFSHEQAYFLNAFLSYFPILLLYGGSARLKRVMVAFLPFVAIADLAMQRRAAVLALALGLVVMLLVTWVALPARRRVVAKILLVAVVILPPYYFYYANKSGLLAQPARAIASNFNPSARDASSNLYRVNEDKDILATMRTSPIIGIGFGKAMNTPYPLADISGLYEFWNILPHNSILWIWMRMGSLGFLFFWILIATAIGQATRLAVRLRDPYRQGWALFILLMVLQQVVVGYLDVQWVNYRNLILLGVLFALLGTLAAIDDCPPVSAGHRTVGLP